MTQEEKAKAYDKAIERAESIYNETAIPSATTKGICTYIFPELKESEDEKIRKEIMSYIKSSGAITNKQWIAWLEKRGEQKPVIEMKTPEESLGIDSYTYNKIVDECIYGEQKPTDKVEPKFKVGDWMVYEENTYQIHNISLKKYYECLRTDGTVHTFDFEYIDSKSHLWTIQDAKDGDVLVHIGCTFIFMGVKNGIVQALEKYLLEGTNPVCFGEPDKDNDYYPATKEQRDALMKAMADVGYTFDFEKKELKKIEQKPVSNQFTPEQANVLDKHIDKFLEQKKPTWSEEDEIGLVNALWCCKQAASIAKDENDMGNVWYVERWLKSLKDRYTWKPSDKQLNNLLDVLSFDNCTLKRRELLESLYNDLKKLKD